MIYPEEKLIWVMISRSEGREAVWGVYTSLDLAKSYIEYEINRPHSHNANLRWSEHPDTFGIKHIATYHKTLLNQTIEAMVVIRPFMPDVQTADHTEMELT